MYSSFTNPILAARGFDDWIQILIVIAVFGGPLLGNVLKKLIVHFSPQEDDKEPAEPQSPTPSMRRRKPSVPVAKPMTSSRRETSSDRRAPVRPMPNVPPPPRPTVESPKTILGELESMLTGPTQDAPVRPARPTPRSTKPPIPRPKPPAKALTTRQDRRRQPARKKATQVPRKKVAASKKAPVAHTHGLLVDLHAGGEGLVKDLAVPVEEISPRVGLLGSPAGLRHAILLSEILAPPLALRESSNTSP